LFFATGGKQEGEFLSSDKTLAPLDFFKAIYCFAESAGCSGGTPRAS
jgi:hypothetical protein